MQSVSFYICLEKQWQVYEMLIMRGDILKLEGTGRIFVDSF